MSESGIARKILDAARQKAEAALGEASRRKQEAVQAGLASLKAEMDLKRESARKRLQERHQQEISAARLSEKNRLNSLKRSLLDGVYQGAWQAATAPAAFRAYVEKRIGDTCKPGDVLVVAREQQDLFRKELAGVLQSARLTVSSEAGAFRAGFVAVRGTLRLNCSLDEAFKAAVRESEIEVARILFGE
jgi:vacuolar-type H+-ATPase subunit E/Vma4